MKAGCLLSALVWIVAVLFCVGLRMESMSCACLMFEIVVAVWLVSQARNIKVEGGDQSQEVTGV